MFLKLLVRHILLLVLAIVLGGLAGATLVRYAPGFDSDRFNDLTGFVAHLLVLAI